MIHCQITRTFHNSERNHRQERQAGSKTPAIGHSGQAVPCVGFRRRGGQPISRCSGGRMTDRHPGGSIRVVHYSRAAQGNGTGGDRGSGGSLADAGRPGCRCHVGRCHAGRCGRAGSAHRPQAGTARKGELGKRNRRGAGWHRVFRRRQEGLRGERHLEAIPHAHPRRAGTRGGRDRRRRIRAGRAEGLRVQQARSSPAAMEVVEPGYPALSGRGPTGRPTRAAWSTQP
jgi:hypothetical protein